MAHSDHEVLIAKFRLKLKKVGKTARPLRFDLNQIPYNYTVKVTNRFKGLELIECLKNYGLRFVTLFRRQVRWSGIPITLRIYDYTAKVTNRFKGLDLID